jgi:branched-chain amino acid transport system substrate-binding protein
MKGMLRRTSSILLLSIALLLFNCRPSPPPFVCADTIGCVEIAPNEPIKVGVLQNLSGQGPPGLFMLHCVELAAEDRGGQLLGHPVELVSADSKCSGEGGTTAALKIAADPQIIGIVGPSCSGAAATAIKVVSEAGLVMISGSSTAPSLTSIGGQRGADWQPGFLRTAQNDAVAGRVAAIHAFQELGKRRAATINAGDAYTHGLTDTFHQAFAELGGKVVLDAAINKGDTDMRPVLNAVTASGAELLFFPVYEPEGNYLVLQAAERAPSAPISPMSAEGLYFETFIAAAGQAGVGMFFTVPAVPQGREYEAFLSRYEAKYQEPPFRIYDATTYDAASLLLSAIGTVAEQDRDGTLHIGRQALRDALYATAAYQGLTGSLTCDEYGDCGVARFHVLRLDDPAAGLAGLEANVIHTYPPEE